MNRCWLEMVFDKYIKKKTSVRGYQLLLVDGYYSHMNLDFFNYTDQNQIIVLVLLPHNTNQLQLLDIRLFSPLSKRYSQELLDFFAKGQKLMSRFKQLFYIFFKKI